MERLSTGISHSFTFFVLLYLNMGLAAAFGGLTNPSFENGSSSSLPAGWSFGPNTSVGYNIGAYVADGNRSLWIARTRTNRNDPLAWVYQDKPAKSAHRYDLNFYAGTHNPAFTQMVSLQFYNSSGSLLLSTSVEINHDVHPSNLLAAYSLSAVAPENTSVVRVSGTANGDYLKLDNMQLSETSPTSFPVEWLDFQAVAYGADAQLTWATASEINASHFEVQRSIDGMTFERLGEVAATGTSQSINEYHFTDNGIAGMAQTTYFYRLRQVDLDGSFTLSHVVELNLDNRQQFEVNAYPNPTTDRVSIALAWTEPVHTLRIMNLQGQELFTRSLNGEMGSASVSVDMTSWPPGTYIVSLIGRDRIETQKILKQ